MPYYSDFGVSTTPISSSLYTSYLTGPYANHSSILASNLSYNTFGKPSARNLRIYKPHLATISEAQSGGPLRRINSPKLRLHTTPQIIIPRPIKINTADIDVSVNKYRKFDRFQLNKQQGSAVEEKKPISVEKRAESPQNEAKPTATIRRDRTTVRLHTIHNDRLGPNQGVKSWRDNFGPNELFAQPRQKPVERKTPGEILKEKFLIKSRSKDNLHKPKLRKGSTKRLHVQKTPSFHDICEAITTGENVEELNPGQPEEIQRRQSRTFTTDELLQEIRRKSEDLSEASPPIKRRASRKYSNENLLKEIRRSSAELAKEELLMLDALLNEEKNLETPVRKKKATKKKSSEKLTLPEKEKVSKSPSSEDVTMAKSQLQRRLTQKRIHRNNTDSSIGEEEMIDKTDKEYQDAIRDISQVEIEKIKVKPKPIITATVNVEEKQTVTPLKAIIDEVEIEESPKPTKEKKFKFNVVVEVDEKKKSKTSAAKMDENKAIGKQQAGLVQVPKAKDPVVANLLRKKHQIHVGHVLADIKEIAKEEVKVEHEISVEKKGKVSDVSNKSKKSNLAKKEVLEIKKFEKPVLKKFVITEIQKPQSKKGSIIFITPKTPPVIEEQKDKKLTTVEEKKVPEVKKIVKNDDKKPATNDEKKVVELKKIVKDEDKKPATTEEKKLPTVKNDENNKKNAISIPEEKPKLTKIEEKSLGTKIVKEEIKEPQEIKKDLKKNTQVNNTGVLNRNITNKIGTKTENDADKLQPKVELKKENKVENIGQKKSLETCKKTESIEEEKRDEKESVPTSETDKKTVEKTKTKLKKDSATPKEAEQNEVEKKPVDSNKITKEKGKKKQEETKIMENVDTNDDNNNLLENQGTEEERKMKKLISKRSLVQKAHKDDPDMEVFNVPEIPDKVPEPEPEPPKEEKFVPLQSNRLSHWMHPFKKPEQYEECPIEIFARPKWIRGRHYPRPRHPQTLESEEEETEDDEEEESTEEETSESEEESTSSEEESDNMVYNKIGASTSSNDSGFDSSTAQKNRNKDCDVNCHKKCEKLTANLCGVNQKLIVEAIESVRKDSLENRDSPTNHRDNPAFSLDEVPEEYLHSSTYSNFQKSGRITPPATTIPRFRKYCIDDFNFLKLLGKGSFGKVLLAELKETEYYYAVKCLKKDVVLEDDDVECTLIERKVLALGTKHPYLCHLLCTFQTDSHLFFVMEYLNGGDLMFHIQQSGRFDEPRARFYAAEIVSGLKFLHNKGIVYRDLKLDNILLDFDGHVRIADFGMCKLQIFLDRMADTFCGTPDYMAPEIIKGQHYNQCVDWWSFGILLYEMLTGQSPFSGCDEDELFWSICNEKPVFPRYLSTEAHNVVQLFLEKDASKRLGNRFCAAGDIQDQPFFRPIDWRDLEARRLEPPFKPNLQHPLDTQYFDKTFTVEKAKLTPIDQTILQSMDQAQFQGFSYTNPNATDK